MKPTANTPWLTMLLSCATVVIYMLPGAQELLQWEAVRTAQSGEWWRLLTCHLTHWNGSHLTWDLLMFAVFGALLERQSRGQFLAVSAATALLIGLMLETMHFPFTSYRGLSGIDSALFACVIVRWLIESWKNHDRSGLLVAGLGIFGLLAKSLLEIYATTPLIVGGGTDFIPVPEAHLAGLIVGVLAAGAHAQAPSGQLNWVGHAPDTNP